MALVLTGTIKDGKVELDNASTVAEGAKVLVTVPDATASAASGEKLRFGMFAGTRETSEEDFKLAEWHCDSDDGLDWTGC